MHSETPPAGTCCTDTREWVRPEGPLLRVGIVPSALLEAGTPVAVELPEPGRQVFAGESIAMVETAKSAFDVYAPTDGTVETVNTDLAAHPQQLALDPWAHWLLVLRPLKLSPSPRHT